MNKIRKIKKEKILKWILKFIDASQYHIRLTGINQPHFIIRKGERVIYGHIVTEPVSFSEVSDFHVNHWFLYDPKVESIFAVFHPSRDTAQNETARQKALTQQTIEFCPLNISSKDCFIQTLHEGLARLCTITPTVLEK